MVLCLCRSGEALSTRKDTPGGDGDAAAMEHGWEAIDTGRDGPESSAEGVEAVAVMASKMVEGAEIDGNIAEAPIKLRHDAHRIGNKSTGEESINEKPSEKLEIKDARVDYLGDTSNGMLLSITMSVINVKVSSQTICYSLKCFEGNAT